MEAGILMKPFLDIINLTIKVYNFEMSYDDYSRKVRVDEYFYPMVIILAINLLAAFAILRIPWYVGIILIVAFISAMFAQKTAIYLTLFNQVIDHIYLIDIRAQYLD